MSLPTWNKMKMDVKLSAKKRYELLRSEINGVSSGSSGQSESIGTLQTSVGTLQTDVGTIQEDITSIKARLDALENEEGGGE